MFGKFAGVMQFSRPMNAKQKAVRLIGAVILGGAALFPPWQLTVENAGATQSTASGFYPLWNPPTGEVDTENEKATAHYRVAVVKLGFELAAILVVVNGAVYLLKDRG